APKDFNSYGSRRGNHEVMMRGTFANIRLRNLLGGGEEPLPEGGLTRHFAAGAEAGQVMPIYDAAMRYREEGVELVVLAGREYGSGSSRDWAAKGTKLLGARAVIAQSFERIHRANLVGMGVLPLQFPDGQSASSLALSGEEVFAIEGIAVAVAAVSEGKRAEVSVRASSQAGAEAPERRLIVVGHIDEIGLIVTHIDDDGYLWFRNVGGWDAQILVGQRVLVDTREGPLTGVVGKKPIHLLRDED